MFPLFELLGKGLLRLPDNYEMRLGSLAAGDDVIKHNGTNTTWTHATGNLAFDNTSATGFYVFDLGTDTNATGYRIRNNSGTVLFEVLGDGSTIFAIDGTNDLSFVINEDAAAGTDEDPSLVLKGGDGAEVVNTTLRQDSSADQVMFQMDVGGTRRSPTVAIGRVGETTASLDAFLRWEAATDAGANKSATATFLGHEDRLTITATDLRLADAVAYLDLTAGALTENALVSANITPSGTLTLRGGGVSQFGDNTGYFAFGGTGALTTSGITTIELDGSGAVTIESSAGAISIGADAVAQAVNIGTGAAARAIAIGNAASASLALEGGVGAMTLAADGGITVNNALTFADGVSVLRLNAGTGAGDVVEVYGPDLTHGLRRFVYQDTVSPAAIETALLTLPANSYVESVQANVQTALTGGGTTVTASIGITGDVDAFGTIFSGGVQADALTQNAKMDFVGRIAANAGASLGVFQPSTVAIKLIGAATGGAAAGDTALTVGSVLVRITYVTATSLANA